MTPRIISWSLPVLLLLLTPGPEGPSAQGPPPTTGWICGVVVDEAGGSVSQAEVTLLPAAREPGAEPLPVGRVATDERGQFCLRELPPGFFDLRAAKASWPMQLPRPVEARAGLMNRLTPLEMELEPGEPRVSLHESFDGMSPSEGRGLMEELLRKGDAASIRELARRLLPKRGLELDLNPLVLGLDVKPLVDELLRQLEKGSLPPAKAARYLYVAGELSDQRTRNAVVPVLLRELRDARRLPGGPAAGRLTYVSDVAIHSLARLAGKDFEWEYGATPIQNRAPIQRAQDWWTRELESDDSKSPGAGPSY